MTCGIYLLEFNNTEQVYIGQAINIEKRFSEHLHYLSSDRADKESIKMRAAYTLYGTPSLHILEKCNVEELDYLEYQYIKEFDAVVNGFNTAYGSIVVLRGEDHFNSKYNNSLIKEVLTLLVTEPIISFKEISTITNVSISTIENISRGISHAWLLSEMPVEYEKLNILKGNRLSAASSAKGRGILYPPIIDPNGNIHQVDNATVTAKQFNLNQSHLIGVLNGKRKSHKGWKLAQGDIS